MADKYYRTETIYTYCEAMQYTGENKAAINKFTNGFIEWQELREGQWVTIERGVHSNDYHIVSNKKFQKEFNRVEK